MKSGVVIWFLMSVIGCQNSIRVQEDSNAKIIDEIDSIDYSYKRAQHEGLTFQDTLIGYMGFPSFDHYQIHNIDDRIYRLTTYKAIGQIFTITEIICDSKGSFLKFAKFKFNEEC